VKKQSGFAGLELIVVIVVVAAVAFVGYYVIHGNNVDSKITPTVSSVVSTIPPVTTPVAPNITTTSNLNSALQALNGTSVSSNNADSTQLSTQSQSF